MSIQLHVQTETNVNCQNNYVYKQKQMQTVKTMTCTNRNKRGPMNRVQSTDLFKVALSCSLARNCESLRISRRAPLNSFLTLCCSRCLSSCSRVPFRFFLPSNLPCTKQNHIIKFPVAEAYSRVTQNNEYSKVC